MWKIVAILLLTLTVVLLARLVYKAPTVQARVGLGGVERMVEAEMPAALHLGRYQGVALLRPPH